MDKRTNTYKLIDDYKKQFNTIISESDYAGFVEPRAVTDIHYNAKLSYWGCQLPTELQSKVDNLVHLYEYAISNYDEEEEKIKPILTKEEWQKLDTDWGEYEEDDEEGWVTVYDSMERPKASPVPINLDYCFNKCFSEETKEEDKKYINDSAVNHPSHYNSGKYETLEVIKDILTTEEYKGFLHGNALKYLCRCKLKGAKVQDLEKCKFYIDTLISEER